MRPFGSKGRYRPSQIESTRWSYRTGRKKHLVSLVLGIPVLSADPLCVAVGVSEQRTPALCRVFLTHRVTGPLGE